jgi:hypothetical protein
VSEGWRLALSFVVGGAWVAGVSAIAERRGARLGGFLGGMPSTLAVALPFVAWTGGTEAASVAAGVVPLSFGVNGLFLLAFVALSVRLGFYGAMGLALAGWAALQGGIAAMGAVDPWMAVAALALAYAACRAGFGSLPCGDLTAAGRSSPRAGDMALRAAGSGLMVMAAVWVSQRWGAVAGGVLASLPVVFISALFIAHRRRGLEFARSLARGLVFSAMVNCSVFALLFRQAVGAMPPLPALLVSYAATALLAISVYRMRNGFGG